MKHKADPNKFKVYRLKTDENIYVAVPLSYSSLIHQEISDYGTLKNIPSDKTVRGIFLEIGVHEELTLNENAPQNDITINQLEEI